MKLIQNPHLQVKPVEAAEGIGEANRDDIGAAWLAAAVLAGAGVAGKTNKKIKFQNFSPLLTYCNALNKNVSSAHTCRLNPEVNSGSGGCSGWRNRSQSETCKFQEKE